MTQQVIVALEEFDKRQHKALAALKQGCVIAVEQPLQKLFDDSKKYPVLSKAVLQHPGPNKRPMRNPLKSLPKKLLESVHEDCPKSLLKLLPDPGNELNKKAHLLYYLAAHCHRVITIKEIADYLYSDSGFSDYYQKPNLSSQIATNISQLSKINELGLRRVKPGHWTLLPE